MLRSQQASQSDGNTPCCTQLEPPLTTTQHASSQCYQHNAAYDISHSPRGRTLQAKLNRRTISRSVQNAVYNDQWCIAKMEVGIRKGAWQRAWRYPAYLWSLRWVNTVKKTPEVGIRRIPAYTPQYTTVNDWIIHSATSYTKTRLSTQHCGHKSQATH